MSDCASPSAAVGPPSVSDGGGSGGPSSSCRSPAAGGDVDDKFDELAGAVFQHCRKQLTNDDDEESFYPIAEQQQKRKLEQQISNRCASDSGFKKPGFF